MTFPEFDKFQAELLNEAIRISVPKGKEYANSADRFGNFNRLSQRLQMSREKALMVYMTKHLDGIESYVNTGQTYSNEPIRGRIIDVIVYLTLLAGMIEEPKSGA